ncbi:MAG: Nif3-like dinuclear metal center hexameric protein [Azonexus sp.]|nr:Nif3-like dinuclear metal center hexameric protein [Azonexus sp.]MCK6411260.1 Nif3-like dinuclear metal center hexameric protein [Azonexus sp.]
MKREALLNYLNGLLEPEKFRDYCPNGLQVEGRPEIQRIVAGVTACQALLDVAVAEGADAILVHHGYFWKGEDTRIAGIRRRRLKTLLDHEINLIAYHLPLDAHPRLGNNAQLAKALGWIADTCFGEQNIVWRGRPAQPQRVGEIVASVSHALGRRPLLIGDPQAPVRRVAWCSGGAQGYFEAAIDEGVDLYLSGEISEQTVHLARETGVAYLAAGHHATECLGIRALAAQVAGDCAIECRMVDIDNPV